MLFASIREKINTFLYDNKEGILNILSYLRRVILFTVLGILVYYHGFSISDQTKSVLINIIKVSFGYYTLHYFIKLLFSFKIVAFIKASWLEAILIVAILIDGIAYYLFHFPILYTLFSRFSALHFNEAYNNIIQIYFLFIVMAALGQSSAYLLKFKIHPAQLFIYSFLIIIGLGTILLMLPEMTNPINHITFSEALFTSTSATCVTGLTVVNTASFFTFKGHVIILILMKLGGLNILAFGTFLAIFSKFGVGVQQDEQLTEVINKDSLIGVKSMLGKIVVMSIVIEAVASIGIFTLLPSEINFDHNGQKIFYSLFHAVSAFNNAGFSLFNDGLYHPLLRESFILHILIALLIFIGSIGFPALRDMFSIKNLRKRLEQPWRDYTLSTKLSLYTTIFLVLMGSIIFFTIEYHNLISKQNFMEKVITSVFQSVTTRTAGFNTIDIASLSTPVVLVFLFLMFIGASSGSTGGGIKTSTFAVLALSAYNVIRGRKTVEFHNRIISESVIYKASSIFFFAITSIFIGIFTLTLTDGHLEFIDLVFEQVSAFSTVGLSRGITSELSIQGKYVIIISMFVGRVGTLTLAFALGKRISLAKYIKPEEQVLVG